MTTDRTEHGVFETRHYLHFYDCDCYKRAKLSTLLKLLAETAGADYAERGYGHQVLWNRGMVFLLSRTNLSIKRMPQNTETLTLTTWEYEVKAAQFIRAFSLLDDKGEVVVSATTAWLLCDPLSHKILRPETFDGEMRLLPDKHPDCDLPQKLRMPSGGKMVGERAVRFSDLDSNGHVYNAVYGDMVCDLLPDEVMKQPCRGFQINYRAEAVAGDRLTFTMATDPDDPNAYYLEGVNQEGKSCFICKYSI